MSLPLIAGADFFTARAGAYRQPRDDVLFVRFARPASVAACFTRSALPAAPVLWSQTALKNNRGRAAGLLVNAGNANAATGAEGTKTARALARAASAYTSSAAETILLASTGIIGEILPPQPIIASLKTARPASWQNAAAAIMTTDKSAKYASARAQIDGAPIVLAGIAKGSGMIAPDMATMLSFIFTDASLPPPVLRAALKEHLPDSFNAISVDGDTSTNDTLMLFATGAAQHKPVRRFTDPRLAEFRKALGHIMTALAKQVIRDGEGAKKLIRVIVSGAAAKREAEKIARAIGESLLVKTAIAGADANWGRIWMAAGKAGVKLNAATAAISAGGVMLARKGRAQALSKSQQNQLARHLAGDEIEIAFSAGAGRARAQFWSCDLTHDYISINADYRS